jgi:ABC-2 type transport system ATP-binding protein
MIRLKGVTKRFGRTVALRDVSFEVGRGEVVGFVGPNGAGKTTALRIISGYIDADRGTVTVAGRDVPTQRREARRNLGYMPESVPLHREMRVAEYLRFRARIKGVARADVRARVDAVCGQAQIEDKRREIIGRLSKGYRQRVGIADALVAEPPILILDEPTAGLDPVQVRSFRKLVKALARDHTVLISSHALAELEAVTSRIVALIDGEKVADAAPAELREELELNADTALDDVFVELARRREESS